MLSNPILCDVLTIPRLRLGLRAKIVDREFGVEDSAALKSLLPILLFGLHQPVVLARRRRFVLVGSLLLGFAFALVGRRSLALTGRALLRDLSLVLELLLQLLSCGIIVAVKLGSLAALGWATTLLWRRGLFLWNGWGLGRSLSFSWATALLRWLIVFVESLLCRLWFGWTAALLGSSWWTSGTTLLGCFTVAGFGSSLAALLRRLIFDICFGRSAALLAGGG